MADSFKDIIITPNRGSSTADPKIEFRGGNATTDTTITIQTYPTSNGTLSFEGSSGQLFSITNDMNGTIFAVNDVSGIPSIEVLDTGLIKLGEFNGSVTINTGTAISGYSLTVGGNTNISGNLVVGGTINATVQGSITTATNLTGGAVGRIPIQSAAGLTSFIPTGTSGQLLQYGTNTATWVSTSSLTVAGAATAQVANTVLSGQRTTNATHYLTFVDSNDASPTADAVYTTSSFVINPSTGNVSINTTTNSQKLTIGAGSILLDNTHGLLIKDNAGTAETTINITSANNLNIASPTAGGSIQFSNRNSAGTIQFFAGTSTGYIQFNAGNSERMRVLSSGNVGIGTSTATSLLHVAGNTLITGITTVSNTTVATSTTTGALQVLGGAGIGGNLYVGGEIVANKLTIQLTTVTTTLIETDDIIKTTNVTQATATATGALQIAGGASVGGNLWVGGNIIGNVAATVSTATNSNNIATVSRTNNADHFLTFVDSNNASATFEALYTTSSVYVNPSNGGLYASSINSGAITSGLGYTPTRTALSTATNSVISADTRNINEQFADRPAGLYVDFKANSTNGLSDGGTYNGVLTFRKYGSGTDVSGGPAQQIAYTDNNNLWHRISTSTSTWGTWVKVIDTGNTSSTLVSSANNIAGGEAGRIPIQSGAGVTSFLPTGSNGQVLTWSGSTATWTSANGATVETLARTTNAVHYVTFVADNNASATAEIVYTTSSFTINPSNGNVVIPGELTAGGTITSGQGVSTGDAKIELGAGRTGAGSSYIDFHSTASTDFEARIIRYAGINGGLDIVNNGTGALNIAAGNSDLQLWTNSSERVTVAANGNVGIGTTSPGSTLHVKPITNVNFRVTNNSTTTLRTIAINDAASDYIDWQQDANQHIFYTSGSERVRINSTGLGISTASPTKKLDVRGDAIFTATSAPTSDIVTISNQGFPVATAGANALQVTYVGGNGAIEASAVRADMTPGSTSSSIWSAFRVAATSAAATGVTFNGVKFDSKTTGTGTSNALWVGTGYDNILNYNGTTVINGSGQVIAAQVLGTVGSATNATNIAGGAANQILYQTTATQTGFINAPVSANSFLYWTGSAFAWSSQVPTSANVLTVARTTSADHYLTFVDSNNASAATEALYTTSSFVINPSTGRVGIGGSPNAAYVVDVQTTGSGFLRIWSTNNGGNTGLFLQGAGDRGSFYADANYNHYIEPNAQFGNTNIILKAKNDSTNTNRVGINLTAPQSTLHVSGDVRITGITTVTNTTQATSTTTGALQVAGGAGIGGNLYVGGSINGTATTANNIAGGAAGRIPIQSGAGTTSFVPTGSNGQVLTWSGTTATWATPSGGTTLNTVASTSASPQYLTFVPDNNAAAAAESFYTTSSVYVVPSTGDLYTTGTIYNKGVALLPSKIQEFTATAGQTTFTITGGYTVNTVQVFANGVALGTADFTASNGTTVVLANARFAGDVIRVVSAATSVNNNATNIVGGAANQIVYQSAANTTNFITAPTTASTYLRWTGSGFDWQAAGGGTASTATLVNTVAQATSATYYPTFVDTNNATATGENVYTTSSFTINPSTGRVGIGTTAPNYNLHVNGSMYVASGIIENSNTISANYTVNNNGLSAGPITVANGVTVTVADGAVWTVV